MPSSARPGRRRVVLFVGVGEKVADLRPFDPAEFVDALFG